jgi:Tol biopolymer transport system component
VRIAAVAALLGSALILAAPGSTVNRPPSLLLFNAPPEVETAFGVVRPNGTGRHVLSDEYSAQAWSPSGRRILAYGGPTSLAILDDQGQLDRALPTAGRFLYEGAWSPNGRWVAGFSDRCSSPSFCADLRILRTDGGEDQTLVSGGVLDLGAGALFDWAPDSRSLAYSGSPSPGQAASPGYKGIVIVSLDGSTVTPEALRNGAEPSWAPQGDRLAFSRAGQIYSALRDGSGLRRLTRGLHSFGPSWSPHGRRVAYLRASGDRFRIEVVDVRSKRVTYIASPDAKVPLVWSPGGSRLTWSDGYRGTDYVFVARADGRGRPRAVTEGVDPDWR